jgi:DUF4097 and DUF4098 domain-containing protein YvlB
VRHTFRTPGPLSLSLRLPAGEAKLATVDGDETTVEIEPLRDNEASLQAVESARVELRERAAGGQELVVEVEERRAWGFLLGRGAEVSVRVRSPHGTNVELDTSSADVQGSGRFGDVSVNSASGDVEFEAVGGEGRVNTASGDVALGIVGGEARVNTASGDVGLKQVAATASVNSASGDVLVDQAQGPLTVRTASGDVVVHSAVSSVSVATASGDQRLDSVAEGEVKLQSASGDMQVGVRQGSHLWIDASSKSGEATSELEMSDVPPDGDAPLVQLRATTMSGDIHVVRAPR